MNCSHRIIIRRNTRNPPLLLVSVNVGSHSEPRSEHIHYNVQPKTLKGEGKEMLCLHNETNSVTNCSLRKNHIHSVCMENIRQITQFH